MLIAIFFAGLICYFSFNATRTAGEMIDGEPLRRTVVTFGFPTPWFEFVANSAGPRRFQWKIDWFSSSAGLMLIGFLAWCLLWQILKSRSSQRTHWIGSPASVAIGWAVLSLLAVLWGFHPLYIDQLIPPAGI